MEKKYHILNVPASRNGHRKSHRIVIPVDKLACVTEDPHRGDMLRPSEVTLIYLVGVEQSLYVEMPFDDVCKALGIELTEVKNE